MRQGLGWMQVRAAMWVVVSMHCLSTTMHHHTWRRKQPLTPHISPRWLRWIAGRQTLLLLFPGNHLQRALLPPTNSSTKALLVHWWRLWSLAHSMAMCQMHPP
jgi:hypothetical protein